MSSIATVIMIGGFVVLFSVIISILNNTKVFDILGIVFSPILNKLNIPLSFVNGLFSGIVELTNGVSIISKIPFKAISLNIIICSFLLGFRWYINTSSGFKYYFNIRYFNKTVYNWKNNAGTFCSFLYLSST